MRGISAIVKKELADHLSSYRFMILFTLIAMAASVLADAVVPLTSDTRGDPERVIQHVRVQRMVSLISPMQLYNDSTGIVIDPMRKTTRSLVLMGPIERLSSARFQRPLALSQSLYVVLPHMITLIAVTFICFGVSYWVFMRQEIRSI